MLKVKMGIISIQDYDRAKQFYTNVLGCKVITDANFGENQRWIELQLPEGETHIALYRAPETEFMPSPCSNIVFSCSNVEAMYQELLKKGVEFSQPPKKESWGISCLFKDSEGNTFCLSSEE